MVFMDEKGCTIHASVRKTLIYKFKPLISEGQVYVIAFFGVCNNAGLFRSTRHEFRLNFQFRTTVNPCQSDLIPLYGCKFMPFEEIFQCDRDFSFLIDVIGVMTAVGTEKEYEKDGRKIKMIVIELDSDNLKLEVALFDDFVDQVTNFIVVGEVHLPIVVIQFAKIKTFRGKIVVQNVMYGTRVLFNPQTPEVETFRNSIQLPLDYNSQSLSMIPDAQYYSIEDDFLNSTAKKSIEDLKDCKDDGFYVVLATVKGMINGQNWWYTACKCNKAVTPDSGMYYYDRCFCHVVNVVPRYRIKVRVMDETDSATFVIWDRDGCRVLGKSCTDLLGEAQKNVEPIGYPEAFYERLIEKCFLFKVEIKTVVSSHFEPTFKVNRICDDEAIIAKFKELNACIVAPERDMTVGWSLEGNSLSLEFQDVQSSATKQMAALSDDNICVGCEDADFEVVCHGTPLKIINNDGSAVDIGEFSSTKMKKVKIEQE